MMFTRKPYRSCLAKKNAKDKLNCGRQQDIIKTKFNILACTPLELQYVIGCFQLSLLVINVYGVEFGKALSKLANC